MPLFGKKNKEKGAASNVSQQITTKFESTSNGTSRTEHIIKTVSTEQRRTVTHLVSSSTGFSTSNPSFPSLSSGNTDGSRRYSTSSAVNGKPINLNYVSPYANKSPPALTTSRSGIDAVPFGSSYRNSPSYSSLNSPRYVPMTPSVTVKKPLALPASLSTSNTVQIPASSKTKNNKQIVVKKTGRFYDLNNRSIPTYSTRGRNRGEVLIINNIMFKDNKSYRHGAQADGTNLRSLFSQMGFTVHARDNLRGSKIEAEVKSFSKRSSLKNVDISVVIIMSHGSEKKTLGAGGYTEIFGVDDEGCPTDQLFKLFTDANCPHMANKPKVFIFQCCRGNNERFLQNDARPFKSDDGSSDLLIAYSTLPGFVSYRNETNGTWYIQTLCEVFSAHAHDCHLEDLLKIVNDKLSEFDDTVRQVSSYESRGFKRCYLHPK